MEIYSRTIEIKHLANFVAIVSDLENLPPKSIKVHLESHLNNQSTILDVCGSADQSPNAPDDRAGDQS